VLRLLVNISRREKHSPRESRQWEAALVSEKWLL